MGIRDTNSKVHTGFSLGSKQPESSKTLSLCGCFNEIMGLFFLVAAKPKEASTLCFLPTQTFLPFSHFKAFLLLLQCIYKAFMWCEGATLSLKGYENQINLYYEKPECCCVTPRWPQRVFPPPFSQSTCYSHDATVGSFPSSPSHTGLPSGEMSKQCVLCMGELLTSHSH